jgi:hydrogenase maturation protease
LQRGPGADVNGGAMSKTVVLGVGNLLMQDEAIGVRVAGELWDRLAAENVEFVIGETDVAYCLGCLCPDNFLVLLDAAQLGGAPGSVRILPIQDAVSCQIKPSAMHELNIVDAIAAEYPAIKGVLIGIEPEVVDVGLAMSECLQSQFSLICEEVEKLLRKILEENKDA